MSEATSGAGLSLGVPGYAALYPGYDFGNKKGGPFEAAFFRVISIASSAAVAADHRAHGLIGSEILSAIDIEQR